MKKKAKKADKNKPDFEINWIVLLILRTVFSLPRARSISKMPGLTVVPVIETLNGWAIFPRLQLF